MTHWTSRSDVRLALEKRPAAGRQGMVVTNHPLGSAAGAEMLALGGNAIDAAVASLFALTVVEPMMVSIFGAGMSTVRLANGERHFVNNYATAPAAAAPDMYRPVSDTWPDYQVVENRENDVGALAVGVPGTLIGWCELLARHGRASLEDVLQPAIRYASRGFRVTGYLHELIAKSASDLARYPESAAIYLRDGEPLAPGSLLQQPDYADTLRALGQEGPDLLYRGALGLAAISHIRELGGIMTTEDLSGFHTVHTTPVHGVYRGYDIYGSAPPSAGGVHISQMLRLLEPYDVASMGFGSPDAMHLLVEALKIAFEDRRVSTGDPAFVDVPVEKLISQAYAAERGQLIDMARARAVGTAYGGESNHTTSLTTADAEGNVVAATHTLHSAFGSKVTVPGTGVMLNNTMNIFDPHPGLANSIAPGKRMTSSMSPTIVEQGDEVCFSLGSVGGTRIFPSVFQAIVNVIDHGMSAQEAVEAPRLWTLGDDVEIESGFPATSLTELECRGHRLTPLNIIGGGMGLIDFREGTMTGASCWRADGTPVGLGGGMARKGIRFEV